MFNNHTEKYIIHVFTDSGVTSGEEAMIKKAMDDAMALYGCSIVFKGKGSWNSGNLCLADAVLGSAEADSRGRINASSVMDAMVGRMKMRGQKGAMILITSKEITLKDKWCFGAAKVGGKASVQSMAYFSRLTDEKKEKALRRTFLHETGHLFRLAADAKRDNVEERNGRHCLSPGCVMRQSPTLTVLMELANEEDPANCLCSLCREDLRRFRKNYHE